MKICSRWSLLAYWAIFFTFFIFSFQPFIRMMNNRVGLIRVEWAGWPLMPGGPGSTRPDPGSLATRGIHHCSSLEEHSVTVRHRAHGNRTRRARSVSSSALAETVRVSSMHIYNLAIVSHRLQYEMHNQPFSMPTAFNPAWRIVFPLLD
ncbi:hypothetical protein M9H77_09384 [Catharanthus roseus]|uniref:Uncharacterized protein n=1 Tax=Catharanthus roseus TaxID=4058 RepID=A0ACC0C0U1_CATRO|nr:hypothetical protein M9H77_09384 [Catharanthus roseus]